MLFVPRTSRDQRVCHGIAGDLWLDNGGHSATHFPSFQWNLWQNRKGFWVPSLFMADQGSRFSYAGKSIEERYCLHSCNRFRENPTVLDPKVGINAISITAATATAENFQVCSNQLSDYSADTDAWQAINDGRYRAIVTNIETIKKEGGGFQKCISKWGDFRPEYKTAGDLRYFIPKEIPFFITSATLPDFILQDAMKILAMDTKNTQKFFGPGLPHSRWLGTW